MRAQNRDNHVTRPFEGLACGAFMLNKRTEEHVALLAEDCEAAYFESPEELVEKTRYYLNSDAEREQIREAGWKKTTTGGNTYCDRLMQILLISSLGTRHRANGDCTVELAWFAIVHSVATYDLLLTRKEHVQRRSERDRRV